MQKKTPFIKQFLRSDEPPEAFLDRKYFRELRWRGISPTTVSNDKAPPVPNFKTLLEVQDFFTKDAHDTAAFE